MVSQLESATYTVDQVAQLLGVNRLTIYQSIRREDAPFPVIRVGRRYVVPKIAIDRLLSVGAEK